MISERYFFSKCVGDGGVEKYTCSPPGRAFPYEFFLYATAGISGARGVKVEDLSTTVVVNKINLIKSDDHLRGVKTVRLLYWICTPTNRGTLYISITGIIMDITLYIIRYNILFVLSTQKQYNARL